MQEKIKHILKEISSYIIIIIVVILIRNFIITPVTVDGSSMDPTLKNSEIVLLEKFDKKNLKRFDIVVFTHNNKKLVKRIIGLPGEKIEYKDNKLYINDELIKEDFNHSYTEDFALNKVGYSVIPDNMYFAVGDNRKVSLDSRFIGPIKKEYVQGKVNLSIWPFKKIK